MTALAAVEQPALTNVEEEGALLGAMMTVSSVIDPVADLVTADDFSEPLHGRIFAAILKLHSEGKSATVITLKPWFDEDPSMKELGGVGYLVRLSSRSGVEAIGARDFARDIADLAKRRRLMDSLREALSVGRDLSVTTDEISAKIEHAVAEANDQASSGIVEMTASEAVTAHLKTIENGLPPGVVSNIGPLDQAMGPIRPGDLQIIAGRPGMGKSILAMSIAKGAAFDHNGVLFISLEMKAEQLGMRLAADLCFDGHSGINCDNIRDGTMNAEQFRRVARAAETIHKLPLSIVDVPAIRAGRIASLIRRHKRKFAARGQNLHLVIVDYLQLLDADRQNDNRTVEVTQISRALKRVAKAEGVGMIALAQLSRKVEEREEKRPRLADLRESGSIEQDADGVLFLYRHDYYLLQNEPPEFHERREKWEAQLKACEGDIEFICAKRRQGATGIRHGRFYGAFQTVRA